MAIAQTANRIFGTHLAPWDVPWLAEVDIDLIRALATEAPRLKENIAKVEAKKNEYRRQFSRKH